MKAGVLLALLAMVSATACNAPDPVAVTSGLEADLRVQRARFVPGNFPATEDPDGAVGPDPDASAPYAPPIVAVINSANLEARVGQRAKEFTGSVSFNASTIAVALDRDRGYWLLPLETADVDLAPNLAFRFLADLSPMVPVGSRTLMIAALDASGRAGPVRTLPLEIASSTPATPLAVILEWDQDMDLDLIVYQPDGSAVTHRGVRSAAGVFANTSDGPRVDVDSNAACRIDGARREIATFPMPLAGHYEVRVQTFRACGVPATGWNVSVLLGGRVASESAGRSFAYQTDVPGDGPSGDGARALAFDIAP